MNTVELNLTYALLRRHEGFSGLPYADSVGVQTLGYGHNLTVPISTADADQIMCTDVHRAWNELHKIFGETLDVWPPECKIAFTDMMFNVGPGRFRKFKRMMEALRFCDWNEAADEMLDSKWATQVGKRATELANMVRRAK